MAGDAARDEPSPRGGEREEKQYRDEECPAFRARRRALPRRRPGGRHLRPARTRRRARAGSEAVVLVVGLTKLARDATDDLVTAAARPWRIRQPPLRRR